MYFGNPSLNIIYDGAASMAAAGLSQLNPYSPVGYADQYEAFELGRLRNMSPTAFLAESRRLESLEAQAAAGLEGAGHDTIVRVLERAMELSRWELDPDTGQVVEKQSPAVRDLAQTVQPLEAGIPDNRPPVVTAALQQQVQQAGPLDGATFAQDMTQMMGAWNELGARIRSQCPQATDAQVEVLQRAFMAVELGLDTEVARQDTAAATKLLAELPGEDAETIQEVGREVSAEFFAPREQRPRMR